MDKVYKIVEVVNGAVVSNTPELQTEEPEKRLCKLFV